MIKSRAQALFRPCRMLRGEDWVMMAKRYEDHPEVIGYDIRNEVVRIVRLRKPLELVTPEKPWEL